MGLLPLTRIVLVELWGQKQNWIRVKREQEFSAAIIPMVNGYEIKKFQPQFLDKRSFLLKDFGEYKAFKENFMKCFLKQNFEMLCAEMC